MADVFDTAKRSAVMRAVKSKDTSPELKVRRMAHALGLRFRLQRADLPGRPDLVFPSRRMALFVHGCFWHGHDCARGARLPATNAAYWRAKIARNIARDAATKTALRRLGWKMRIVWECETRDPAALARLIRRRLRPRTLDATQRRFKRLSHQRSNEALASNESNAALKLKLAQRCGGHGANFRFAASRPLILDPAGPRSHARAGKRG